MIVIPQAAEDPRTPDERAIGLMFDWCVTAASLQMEPRVIVAQFGDGYAQRRPDGINNEPQNWDVELRNVLPADAHAIHAFLHARAGHEAFSWQQPRTTTVHTVICPSWSIAYGEMLEDGERLFDITATFEQAYL